MTSGADKQEIADTTPRMPSVEYLLDCSEKSLRDIELGALNRSANCLKAARLEFSEAIAQREIAGVARWLIENRTQLLEHTSRTVEISQEAANLFTISGPKKGLDMLLGEAGSEPKGKA